jgi:hypothetical protein
MEFTIVMSCLPIELFAGSTERHPFVELRVSSEATSHAGSGAGVFDVEGVIVGDERTWTQASFRWLGRDGAAPVALKDDRSTYVMLLRPSIDRLSRSVHDAREATATQS